MVQREYSYIDIADIDYDFIKGLREQGIVNNNITSVAQNACEKYLKGIIQYFGFSDIAITEMRTHSLKKLCRFIQVNINDIVIDESTVCKADGYYFSTRYPGDDFFIVTETDIEACWEAIDYLHDLCQRLPSKQQHNLSALSELAGRYKK